MWSEQSGERIWSKSGLADPTFAEIAGVDDILIDVDAGRVNSTGAPHEMTATMPASAEENQPDW